MLDIPTVRQLADSIPASVGHLAAGDVARRVIHELCDELQEERDARQRVEQQRARLKDDCGFVG